MISANGGLPAHRYTPQVTPRWPRGSEPASQAPGYPHGDTNVPPTHMVGGAVERHRHNRQGPHIHVGSKAGDPTGTGGPF